MARRRPLLVLAATAAALVVLPAGPAPASVTPAPSCWSPEVWARAGQTRTYELHCPLTERVELLEGPHGSRFEGLVTGERLKFRLTPDASAPENDALTLRLTGPGGSADQVIQITNVPPTRNTAPRCDPVSVAERTDGVTPREMTFHVICWDDEYDEYTLYGGGPGTHVTAPLRNGSGTLSQAGASWHYIPTITSGEEQTTYYAIDSQGARSADAPISVQLGPAVDRPPSCLAQPRRYSEALGAAGVTTRPGVTRRFLIICDDPDGDALVPRIQTPPSRGDLTRFAVQGGGVTGVWGQGIWIDAAYTPRSSYTGTDAFAIAAAGPRGETVSTMAMVTRPLPENGRLHCGSAWSDRSTDPATVITLDGTCSDDDGDPVTVSVAEPPAHGMVGAPVVTPDLYGEQHVELRYMAVAGYKGADSVTLAATEPDGTTSTIRFTIDVGWVLPGRPVPYGIGTPFDWPELRPPPIGATWLPATGQAPPVSPVEQARRALGQRSVRLVKRIGDARIYALRTALTTSAKPGRALAVTCPVRCAVTSSGSVAGKSAGSAKVTVKPGKASALTLRLSAAQRRQIKRAGSARAVFKLTVARAERKARRGTVKLSVRG